MTQDPAASLRMKAAFAMGPSHLPTLFSDQDVEDLRIMLDFVSGEPITNFASVPDADLAEVEVLVTGWEAPVIDLHALERMPRLHTIVHAAGTVRTFVTDSVFERGIKISTAAEANAVPVAEYTLAAIIMGLKRSSRFVHQYRHEHVKRSEAGMPWLGANNVTIGIVGASRVGRKVIGLLRCMDVDIVVSDPFLSKEEAAILGVRVTDLDTLCRTSDVVSLHAPDMPATWNMIGAEQLSVMADGTLIINTARGRLIEPAALTEELVSGRLDAYLDVTNPEPLPADSVLFTLPNVVITPHIAGAMGNEVHRLGSTAVGEIQRLVHGLPLTYAVLAQDLARIA